MGAGTCSRCSTLSGHSTKIFRLQEPFVRTDFYFGNSVLYLYCGEASYTRFLDVEFGLLIFYFWELRIFLYSEAVFDGYFEVVLLQGEILFWTVRTWSKNLNCVFDR